jgi:hypothetical protein
VSQECATKSGSCGQKGHSGISTATGKALEETQTAIEICAAADETAFEQDVLVLMDLSSG